MQKQKADLDIESGKFERIYLISGDEPYLIKYYKDKLKNAIIPEKESLNYAYYDNVSDNIEKIKDFVNTMPFFSDRRLVIIEKASVFKKDTGLADFVPLIPDTSTVVICDEEIDKRSKLYKAIQKNGAVMELKKLNMQDLKVFIVSRIKKADKGITEKDCEYLIESIGDDLYTVVNEVDKCIAFAGDSKAVDRRTIDSVCSMQIENKIFEMVDAILQHKASIAYRLYGDLLSLHENSFGMMAVIRNNYNKLLIVKEMMDNGRPMGEIMSITRMADWQVRKNMQKIKNYSSERLVAAIKVIVDTEYSIKTGNIGEQTGIEIMLANLLKL